MEESAAAFGEFFDAGNPQPTQTDQQNRGSDDRPRQSSGQNSRFHETPTTGAR
jgi:hypothetical protein